MRVIVHYNGDYKDELTIDGDSLEEIMEIADKECELRRWERLKCWSEVQE